MRDTSSVNNELERNIERAFARGRRAAARVPHAVAARFDRASGRIVIDLSNGCQFAFPSALAQGLRDAKTEDLRVIEVSPAGTGLHWPRLDADLMVIGLLAGVFGSKVWARELAALGRRSKTPEKAAAARAKGAKGGRPRNRSTPAHR